MKKFFTYVFSFFVFSYVVFADVISSNISGKQNLFFTSNEKKEYTAKDYIQDGLIAMFDGIENASWGVHDDSISKWTNLADETYSIGYQFGEVGWDSNSFVSRGGCMTNEEFGVILQNLRYCTIECISSGARNGANRFHCGLFSAGGARGIIHQAWGLNVECRNFVFVQNPNLIKVPCSSGEERYTAVIYKAVVVDDNDIWFIIPNFVPAFQTRMTYDRN